jgi:hypothetical protein
MNIESDQPNQPNQPDSVFTMEQPMLREVTLLPCCDYRVKLSLCLYGTIVCILGFSYFILEEINANFTNFTNSSSLLSE